MCKEPSLENLKSILDSIASYAWRTDPPNANNKLTDSERLHMIKYHPAIYKLGAVHRELAEKEINQ